MGYWGVKIGKIWHCLSWILWNNKLHPPLKSFPLSMTQTLYTVTLSKALPPTLNSDQTQLFWCLCSSAPQPALPGVQWGGALINGSTGDTRWRHFPFPISKEESLLSCHPVFKTHPLKCLSFAVVKWVSVNLCWTKKKKIEDLTSSRNMRGPVNLQNEQMKSGNWDHLKGARDYISARWQRKGAKDRRRVEYCGVLVKIKFYTFKKHKKKA